MSMSLYDWFAFALISITGLISPDINLGILTTLVFIFYKLCEICIEIKKKNDD